MSAGLVFWDRPNKTLGDTPYSSILCSRPYNLRPGKRSNRWTAEGNCQKLPDMGTGTTVNCVIMRWAFAASTLVVWWALPAIGLAALTGDPEDPDSARARVDTVASPVDPTGQLFQLGDTASSHAIRELRGSRTLKSQNFISSPTGTLLKSVAFPGWGQWANGKKQKAAIYFGIESYWITKALIWRHRARTADDFAEYTHAQDRRNFFYWLTGITVFVSMFDAYADRYLLTLERTRNMPEDFWGTHPELESPEQWRLTLSMRF